ncbi:flavodoxin domain-containing protein [Microlunatus sp. GCM10028923]|uniref:flavodoxin domain-containing protein n=1 Tax=Microlunatus sp. GCM10028923 TaxID=3273400 RepID=UPI003607A07A
MITEGIDDVDLAHPTPPPEARRRRPPMSRVLITYASRMGSTAEIARALGDQLIRRGVDAVVLPTDRVRSLTGFDAVVVGSAVYLRRWLPEALHWLKANAPELAERPTWLFQSGPCGADSPDPDRVPRAVDRLAFAIGAEPPVTFGGRLDRALARSPLQRWISDGPLAGDYRDWDVIAQWGDTIADRLIEQPQNTTP